MTDFIEYDMETSEKDLYTDFGKDCKYAKALPTQVYGSMSWLVLVDNLSLNGDTDRRWTVMGSLMPAWGIERPFDFIEEDQTLYGHYIIQRDLNELLADNETTFDGRIEIDPEGSTFFAYTDDEDTGRRFIDWIEGVTNNTERTTA